MIIISYDIKDDKLRYRFAKMLSKNGAIRLQYSVYELNYSNRTMENVKLKIDTVFSKLFSGADSVLIFEVQNQSVIKYGNAIHRDLDIVFL